MPSLPHTLLLNGTERDGKGSVTWLFSQQRGWAGGSPVLLNRSSCSPSPWSQQGGRRREVSGHPSPSELWVPFVIAWLAAGASKMVLL